MSGLPDPTNSRYREGCSLQNMKLGLVGAVLLGPIMQRLLQSLMALEATLGQLWGMTEMTCIATCVRPGKKSEEVNYFRSVGTPVPNLKLKIVDEDRKYVSHVAGVRGEIPARTPAVMKGYFEDEKANRKAFDESHVRSEDIGYVDSKIGLWYIVDRRKDLTKVRRYQVAQPGIEVVLLSHLGIAGAAVIEVKMRVEGRLIDFEWHGRPRAYLVRKIETAQVREKGLKNWVLIRLVRYNALDVGVRCVDAMPKNASGKILKVIVEQ